MKVFGPGDRQKDRQSSELGGPGEIYREINLSFRRKREATSTLDGSGHKGLADLIASRIPPGLVSKFRLLVALMKRGAQKLYLEF